MTVVKTYVMIYDARSELQHKTAAGNFFSFLADIAQTFIIWLHNHRARSEQTYIFVQSIFHAVSPSPTLCAPSICLTQSLFLEVDISLGS